MYHDWGHTAASTSTKASPRLTSSTNGADDDVPMWWWWIVKAVFDKLARWLAPEEVDDGSVPAQVGRLQRRGKRDWFGWIGIEGAFYLANGYIPLPYRDNFVALWLVCKLHLRMRLRYDCETIQVMREAYAYRLCPPLQNNSQSMSRDIMEIKSEL